MAETALLTKELDDVISACKHAVTLAGECAMHCLESDDPAAMKACIRHCLDVADVASACIQLASRSSAHVDKICGVTSAVAEACADVCAGMADGDELMERCAEACRSAAQACRDVIGSQSS